MAKTLEIGHIGKTKDGKYVAHIGVVDKEADIFAPYRTITIEATNEEFARRIAEIRVEEMISSDSEGSFRSVITAHDLLVKSKDKHFKKYIDIKDREDALWTAQENTLAEFLKEAQTDVINGINIRSFDIEVELDGEKPLLVYAIRTFIDDSEEWVELLVSFTGDEEDLEWCSIYDFYCGTAGKILDTLMQNL